MRFSSKQKFTLAIGVILVVGAAIVALILTGYISSPSRLGSEHGFSVPEALALAIVTATVLTTTVGMIRDSRTVFRGISKRASWNEPEVISQKFLSEHSRYRFQDVVEKLEAELKKNRARMPRTDPQDFTTYIRVITDELEGKIAAADETAETLLDTGKGYVRLGMLFFVVSIVAWQLVVWATAFKDHHLYGMMSCSLLFVFIELISWWFLGQYRKYVESASMLVRLKSTFDRYALAYFAAKEMKVPNSSDPCPLVPVLTLIQTEIKWDEPGFPTRKIARMAHDVTELAGKLIPGK